MRTRPLQFMTEATSMATYTPLRSSVRFDFWHLCNWCTLLKVRCYLYVENASNPNNLISWTGDRGVGKLEVNINRSLQSSKPRSIEWDGIGWRGPRLHWSPGQSHKFEVPTASTNFGSTKKAVRLEEMYVYYFRTQAFAKWDFAQNQGSKVLL